MELSDEYLFAVIFVISTVFELKERKNMNVFKRTRVNIYFRSLKVIITKWMCYNVDKDLWIFNRAAKRSETEGERGKERDGKVIQFR